jgi:hypothetical protein
MAWRSRTVLILSKWPRLRTNRTPPDYAEALAWYGGWAGGRGEGPLEVPSVRAEINNPVPPAGLGSGMVLGAGHEGGG